jgi:hypothetical protein
MIDRLSLTRRSWEVASPAGLSTFTPIPQLNRTDAKVTLLFLANIALYPEPVLDPWFEAQFPQDIFAGPAPYATYGAQDVVSVLGCSDATQICNPLAENFTNCVSVHNYNEDYGAHSIAEAVGPASDDLGLNSQQSAVLSRLILPLANAIDMALSAVTYDGNMLATRATDTIFSAALPSDQWILELQHWFAILLTSIQASVTDSLTGIDPRLNHYIEPMIPEYQWMCHNQIVQNANHSSFSVLGLVIILIVGGLLMVINSLLSTAWSRSVRRTAGNVHRDEEWKAYELLELQRTTTHKSEEPSPADRRSSVTSIFKQYFPKAPTHKASKDEKGDEKHPASTVPKMDSSASTHSSTEATIDVQIEQDDFISPELARLISRDLDADTSRQ